MNDENRKHKAVRKETDLHKDNHTTNSININERKLSPVVIFVLNILEDNTDNF